MKNALSLIKDSNLLKMVIAVVVGVLFVVGGVGAATTISTNVVTEGDLQVDGNSTIGSAVSDSVTANAYFTQLRIGTESTFGHIGTVGADELGVEGDTEIDGTLWVDGVLQASSTLLVGSTATITATTTVGTSTLYAGPGSIRVGIGTTTPLGLLHVENQIASSSIIVSTKKGSVGGSIILEDTDGAGCTEIFGLDGAVTAAVVTCPVGI